MRPFAELRRLFSPYEFAVAARLVLLILAPAALLLVIVTRAGKAGFILFVPLILLGGFLEQLSRCPTCRRRPGSHYLVDRSTGEKIPVMTREWPERVCSGCGTSLDGI